MKSSILIIAICALLVGCKFDMPAFDVGKLEHHVTIDGRDSISTTALSQAQLSALTQWFSTHQSGWKKSYVDAGPERFVSLSRGGTEPSYFNLTGNTLYAASYSKLLTLEEQHALEKILDEKKS